MLHSETLSFYSAGLLACMTLCTLMLPREMGVSRWLASAMATGSAGCLLLGIFMASSPIFGQLGIALLIIAFALCSQEARSGAGIKASWSLLLLPTLGWHIASSLIFRPFNWDAVDALCRLGLVAGYSLLTWDALRRGPLGKLQWARRLAFIPLIGGVMLATALPFTAWLPYPAGAGPAEGWMFAVFHAQLVIQVVLAGLGWPLMRREQAIQLLAKSSKTDVLTGLYNRALLLERQAAWDVADRNGRQGRSLIFFDIDNFKDINDSLGHAVGDKVIVCAAQSALRAVREGDWVFRMGGEEFLCVLPGTTSVQARAIAERIRLTFAECARVIAPSRSPTLSAGTASRVGSSPSIEELTALADACLYEGKRSGRNCVRSWP